MRTPSRIRLKNEGRFKRRPYPPTMLRRLFCFSLLLLGSALLPAFEDASFLDAAEKSVRLEVASQTDALTVSLVSDAGENGAFSFAQFSFPKSEIVDAAFHQDAAETSFSLTAQTAKITFSVLADPSLNPGGAFVAVTSIPLYREDRTEIDFWRLPAVSIPIAPFAADSADSLRAFGTGGVKPVDGHAGSYSFLGIVHPANNRGVLAGWLTNRRGNGVLFSTIEKDAARQMQTVQITPQVDYGRLRLAPNHRETGETLILGYFDDLRDGLESYGDALAAWNGVKLKPAPTGYCTWYSDKNRRSGSEETTAEFAQLAQEKLVPYGFSFFQIDDGWQLGDSSNGPNKNFTAVRPDGPYPSGLQKTSEALAKNGLVTGLWLMPFSGNFDDPWFSGERADLFVKSAIDYPAPGEKNTRRYSEINQTKNAPYEAFWGGTALDATNPKTRGYISDMIRRITREWGCRYLKIDGLWMGGAIEQLYVNDEYAPDDIGKQIFADENATNIDALRQGLVLVRDAAGEETFILGCNLSQNMRTLGAAVGFVDAMRIGPDNGAAWDRLCVGPWRGTNRYFYNARVWWNDPDPVYVRDSIPLSHAQLITSWAALTGQLYAFSDWLGDLSEERVNVLRRTMPNHQRKTVRPVDLFTEDFARVWILSEKASDTETNADRFVAGYFNWKETESAEFEMTPASLGLPTVQKDGTPIEKYAVYDFWGERLLPVIKRGESSKITVPGGSCLIAAIRPIEDRPFLLSSSRHISQGILEVTGETWDAASRTLTVTVDSQLAALSQELPYRLRVYAPDGEKLTSANADGAEGEIACQETADGDAQLWTVTLPRLTTPSENTAITLKFK